MPTTEKVSGPVTIEHPRAGRGGNGDIVTGNGWHDGWGREQSGPIPNAKFVIMLVCAGSVMFFVALTGGYIVLRFSGQPWPPPGMPPLPKGLWLNTALIAASSVAFVWGTVSIRRRHVVGLQRGLLLATLLGFAFIARQVIVWKEFTAAGVTLQSGVYGSVFYMLTMIHALHVLGGLAFLSYVTAQAWRGRYGREHHLEVEVCGIYWHFVDALWLYLFTILYLI